MRNFQKLKTIEDYKILDAPEPVHLPVTNPPRIIGNKLMILRMLIKPKYGEFIIPMQLLYLQGIINDMYAYDQQRTGIKNSWCYLTIRHGVVKSVTDDEWHFDGSSFRTDIIPERNYIWVDKHPTEYKAGNLVIPYDFDPIKHNLFTFAEHQLQYSEVKQTEPKQWYLLSPFCLHRRPRIEHSETEIRTFIRICFTDIEGRDVNNTTNPLLPTPFYGRDPVNTFRNKLTNYYETV